MFSNLRIGHGYDVHRLVEGRRCIIGGVDIPYERGLLGHSDADVLAHALADAILGACRGGDIGKLFPDTDPAYEGADSMVLLARVMDYARELGVPVDATHTTPRDINRFAGRCSHETHTAHAPATPSTEAAANTRGSAENQAQSQTITHTKEPNSSTCDSTPTTRSSDEAYANNATT